MSGSDVYIETIMYNYYTYIIHYILSYIHKYILLLYIHIILLYYLHIGISAPSRDIIIDNYNSASILFSIHVV